MKNLFFIISIIAISCCSSQKNTAANNSIQNDPEKNSGDTLPVCIKKMIDSFKTEDKQNPPRKVFSYLYNGNTVYYVTPPCCDFFSNLYNTNCVLIAHPDGGFTGRGDGRAADFIKIRTNEKLIWADERK